MDVGETKRSLLFLFFLELGKSQDHSTGTCISMIHGWGLIVKDGKWVGDGWAGRSGCQRHGTACCYLIISMNTR